MSTNSTIRIACLLTILLCSSVATGLAAEPKAKDDHGSVACPVVLQIASLEDILSRVQTIAARLEEAVPKVAVVRRLIDSMTKPEAQQASGLDFSRPWGAFVTPDDEARVVLLIPVANTENLLQFLKPLGVDSREKYDDVYVVTRLPYPPMWMEVRDGYAWLSAIPDRVSPQDPATPTLAKVFSKQDELLSLRLRMNAPIRQQLLEAIEADLERSRRSVEVDDATRTELKVEEWAVEWLRTIAHGVHEVTAKVDLDESGNFVLDAQMTPHAESKLSKRLADGNEVMSPLRIPKLPGELAVRFTSVVDARDNVFKEAFEAQALDGIPQGELAHIVRNLDDTAAFYFELRNTPEGPSAVGIAAVRDGRKIEHELITSLMELRTDPGKEQAPNKVVGQVAGVNVYVVPPHDPEGTPEAFRNGEYIAVADKFVVVAFGRSQLERIKQVLNGKPGGSNAVWDFEASMIQSAMLAHGGKLPDALEQMRRKLFAASSDRIVIRSRHRLGLGLRCEFNLAALVYWQQAASYKDVPEADSN